MKLKQVIAIGSGLLVFACAGVQASGNHPDLIFGSLKQDFERSQESYELKFTAQGTLSCECYGLAHTLEDPIRLGEFRVTFNKDGNDITSFTLQTMPKENETSDIEKFVTMDTYKASKPGKILVGNNMQLDNLEPTWHPKAIRFIKMRKSIAREDSVIMQISNMNLAFAMARCSN